MCPYYSSLNYLSASISLYFDCCCKTLLQNQMTTWDSDITLSKEMDYSPGRLDAKRQGRGVGDMSLPCRVTSKVACKAWANMSLNLKRRYQALLNSPKAKEGHALPMQVLPMSQCKASPPTSARVKCHTRCDTKRSIHFRHGTNCHSRLCHGAKRHPTSVMVQNATPDSVMVQRDTSGIVNAQSQDLDTQPHQHQRSGRIYHMTL